MSNKTFSNSITLTRVADGKSASTLIIETEYDEILKFEPASGLVFSPEYYRFSLLDLSKSGEENQKVKNFAWKCGYLNKAHEYVAIADSKDEKWGNEFFLHSIPQTDEQTESQPQSVGLSVEYSSVYLDITSLYANLSSENHPYLKEQIELGSVVFKLVCGVSDTSTLLVTKYFCLKNGVSADMAKLEIDAASISASIRDGSLRFSSTGLSLTNGNFEIIKVEYKQKELTSSTYLPGQYYTLDSNNSYVLDQGAFDSTKIYFSKESISVLYADKETGNLSIHGDVYANNGYFKGEIEATSGSFTGTIDADEGLIGGFTISKSELTSSDGGIILNGSENKISAENIELGGGACVTDKIVFTNGGQEATFALYNPSLHEGKILESAQVIMTNEGCINLGTLELYGGTGNLDGYMRSAFVDANNQSQNGYWRINEDGTAYFNNITANDLHIQKSILEIDTVQSVGGTMIFKEAWTIIESIIFESNGVSYTGYRLDKIADIAPDSYIMVDDEFYKVSATQNADGEHTDFSIYGTSQLKRGAIVSKFGLTGTPQWLKATEIKRVPGRSYFIKNEENIYIPYDEIDLVEGTDYYYYIGSTSNDCVISIRSDSTNYSGPQYNYSSPQSLCFSSFYNFGSNEEPTLAFTKHLLLGKLNESGIDDLSDISGYGLYADNVYLNGSLTTRLSNDGGYAGINTLNNSTFTKSPDSTDTSSIIFWGGASGKNNISNAPFQVTAKGTLYAQNAIIENSAIIGTTLEATTIKTANIYGISESGTALNFFDVQKGIGFIKTVSTGVSDDLVEVFSIGETGLKAYNNNFITIPDEQSGSVKFLGVLESNSTIYGPDKIEFSNKFEISLRDNGTCLKLQEKGFDFNNNAYFDNGVFYGRNTDGSYLLEHRKKEDGYDIYIY